jgi:hypothetical protein
VAGDRRVGSAVGRDDVSLVFGTLALARITRTGQTGRWAAVVGIGFGAVFYAILIAIVVWDLIDPVELHR